MNSNRIEINEEDSEIEGVQITLITGKILNIISIYVPPNQPLPTTRLDNLLTSMNNVIIIGDLNAKHTDLGCKSTNPSGKQLLELIDQHNLYCTNEGEPTRYPHSYTQNHQPEQLDYCLLSPDIVHLFEKLEIGDDLNSDHKPLILTLATSSKKINRTKRPNFKHADWILYRHIITTNLPDCEIHTINDIDAAATKITDLITTASSQAIPTNPPPRRFQLPKSTIRTIRYRRKLRRIYNRTRAASIKTQINRLNKEISDEIASRYKQEQENRCKQLTDTADPSEFWKTSKRILGVKKKTSSKIPPLTFNDRPTATTDQAKADIFREYFATVHNIPDKPSYNKDIYKLANYIKRGYYNTYHPVNTIIETEDTGHEEFVQIITPTEILNCLRKTKNTSPGRDGIQYIHLKAAPPCLIDTLSRIYTASLHHGHMPNIWKTAITILLPKPKKDHKHPSNYRPISLLPVLGKCLEKIISKRLTAFLETNNILPDSQAGFRSGRSTRDQLFRIIQDIATCKNRGRHTLAAFFDAEKAFDRIWHEGLLLKLRKFNTPTKLTRWISSYLTSRTTCFRINNTLSSPLNITTGTPQGSTISPILFITYVADIPQPTKNTIQLSQFADDIAIWSSHPQVDRAEQYLQHYINKIQDWCNDWRLTLNPNKSQLMYISKHNRLQRAPHITFNDTAIPATKQVQYLGINIDQKLRLSHQFNIMAKRFRPMVTHLHRLAGNKDHPRADPSTTMKIYKMMIRPIIEYAAPALYHCHAKHIEELEKTQRRACRIAYHLHYREPSATTIQIANIPSVHQRLTTLREKFLTNITDEDHYLARFVQEQLQLPARHLAYTPLEGYTLN